MADVQFGLLIQAELEKAAYDNGFRLERGLDRDWLRFGSTTARVEIWLDGDGVTGPWRLSLSDAALARELGAPPSSVQGPGAFTFEFAAAPELHAAVDRAWRLSASLPDAPLAEFEAEIAGLPRKTEAERLVIERVGQDVFREALLKYWSGRCPLTGIGEPALLRASHIVRWADCESDAQRLDVHNGLLLSALWDAAFDAGLVSFADNGHPLASADLGPEARARLGLSDIAPIPGLTDKHRANLARHRARYGFR